MILSNLQITRDGSHTLYSNMYGETYHSSYGSIQESKHIFIHAGLDLFLNHQHINVLEIGFGTGLNALLSLLWAEKHKIFINYHGIEAFPILSKEISELNFPEILGCDRLIFENLHKEEHKNKADYFNMNLIKTSFLNYLPDNDAFDLIYFDAFSPESQPEMWSEEGFKKLFHAMKSGGVLTTYSCKGSVKRALKAAGFGIEKLPGPPGKREFIRATVTK